MKAIFTTEDEMEAKRMTKALDMALFIWQLQHNCTLTKKDNKIINELLEKYSINIDDLIE